jgi:tetratricopeptide (TPR) repeat protein
MNLNLSNSLISTYHASLLNLESLQEQILETAPLYVQGVNIAYNNFKRQETRPLTTQVNPPEVLRKSLERHTRKPFDIQFPDDLPEEYRTSSWNSVREAYLNYSQLNDEVKLLLILLLLSLGLPSAAMKLASQSSLKDISNSVTKAKLGFYGVMAELITILDTYKTPSSQILDKFEEISQKSPLGSTTRLNAQLQLVVMYAKFRKDLVATAHWSTLADKELDNLKPVLTHFEFQYVTSIVLRAVAYLPLLKGDYKETDRIMKQCLNICTSLNPQNPVEETLKRENEIIIRQSTSKAYLFSGNLEAAEDQARRIINLDPLHPKYHYELGNLLIKQERFEEGAKAYMSATRLGHPETALSWYMAGECWRIHGDVDLAMNCYLSCLESDPTAVSALKQLSQLASSTSNKALVDWCQVCLEQLRNQGSNRA